MYALSKTLPTWRNLVKLLAEGVTFFEKNDTASVTKLGKILLTWNFDKILLAVSRGKIMQNRLHCREF